MNPNETSLLLSLAQVAVTLAGFSAIVVLFGRGDSGRWRRAQADRFHGMVVHAMVAVLFCLLPLLAGVFSTDRALIWNVVSAVLGIEIVLHVTAVLFLASSADTRIRMSVGVGYLVAVVLFMNVAGVMFNHEFRAYLIGVLWHVIMSGLLFVMLIWVPRAEVDSD